MAKSAYSASERKSFKNGFFAGLRKAKKKKLSTSATPKRKRWFSFLAFNDNCDVFNVDVYDTSRNSALKQARSKLKRDPEMPCWGVSVTNDNGDKNQYFRTVTVDENVSGGVSDNWKRHYRSTDDEIRRKYGGDLSKPLKKSR